MFDNAGSTARGQQERDLTQGPGCARLDALLSDLNQSNLRVMRDAGSGSTFSAGSSLSVLVGGVLNSPFEAQKLCFVLRHYLQSRVPVSLTLTELNFDGNATQALQDFCEYLRSALASLSYAAADISLTIYSHQMSLRAFLLISNSVLGSGPRFVMLDTLQMNAHSNRAVRDETERNWRFLWQQRKGSERLLPAYGGLVKSACPIASDEVARTILPIQGMVVPANSAWLPINLPLAGYACAGGNIDWSRLSAAIRKSVHSGDQILDLLSWPCWRQSMDAKLHRRLAITLTGLGDLVVRCGYDPRDNHCLAWLTIIVKRIRDEMRAVSVELARHQGVSPALLHSDPSKSLLPGPARDDWQRRWQLALETSALRHRNLLVMSPYSVLPGNTDENIHFTDLLPVIGVADAWCFSATSGFAEWNLQDYQRFHRRAWAVIHAQSRGCAVAGGV